MNKNILKKSMAILLSTLVLFTALTACTTTESNEVTKKLSKTEKEEIISYLNNTYDDEFYFDSASTRELTNNGENINGVEFYCTTKKFPDVKIWVQKDNEGNIKDNYQRYLYQDFLKKDLEKIVLQFSNNFWISNDYNLREEGTQKVYENYHDFAQTELNSLEVVVKMTDTSRNDLENEITKVLENSGLYLICDIYMVGTDVKDFNTEKFNEIVVNKNYIRHAIVEMGNSRLVNSFEWETKID